MSCLKENTQIKHSFNSFRFQKRFFIMIRLRLTPSVVRETPCSHTKHFSLDSITFLKQMLAAFKTYSALDEENYLSRRCHVLVYFNGVLVALNFIQISDKCSSRIACSNPQFNTTAELLQRFPCLRSINLIIFKITYWRKCY